MRHALLNLCRRHNKRQLHMTCTARVHIRFLFAYKYIYICSVSGFHTDSCMTRTMEGTSRNSHKKNITKVTNEIIKSMQFTHQSPLNTHCILHAVCYCYVGGIGERRRALWQTFKFAPPIVGGWWVMGDDDSSYQIFGCWTNIGSNYSCSLSTRDVASLLHFQMVRFTRDQLRIIFVFNFGILLYNWRGATNCSCSTLIHLEKGSADANSFPMIVENCLEHTHTDKYIYIYRHCHCTSVVGKIVRSANLKWP